MLDSLKQIRSVLAVARCGSFTRAADQLYISQSALTVQVQQLEAELAIRIFDRDQRRVAVTAEGRQILPNLERLILDADALLENTSDLSGLRRGLITVAVLPSIAAHILPFAMRMFRREYPAVRIEVRDMVASRVVQFVKSGEADLGIAGDIARDRELSVDPLITDRLCAYVPKEHPFASKALLTLRELTDEPLVLTGVDSSVRELITKSMRRERLSLPPSLEVNYISTALGMVEAGLGIAILPDSALNGSGNAAIQTVPLEKPTLKRRITIIRRRGTAYSQAAAELVRHLKLAAGKWADTAHPSERRKKPSK